MEMDKIQKRVPLHMIVYGEPKVGKTTLVSKLATKYKLIWVSVDNGHGILFKLPKEVQKNIDLIIIPDTVDNPNAFDTLRKLFKPSTLATKVCHRHGVVSCSLCSTKYPADNSNYNFTELDIDTIVVIDHLTAVGNSAMAIVKKNDKETEKPSFNDFGAQGLLMDRLMTTIQHSNINVVCIAQPLEGEMEEGKKRIVPSVGTRNYSVQVSKFFDVMVYLHMENRTHKAGSMTTYSLQAQTGSRDDVAIENMKEPSLIPFFEESTKFSQTVKDEEDAQGVLTRVSEDIAVAAATASNSSAAGTDAAKKFFATTKSTGRN